MSQNGNLPQIGVNIKNIWNHHLENDTHQDLNPKNVRTGKVLPNISPAKNLPGRFFFGEGQKTLLIANLSG